MGALENGMVKVLKSLAESIQSRIDNINGHDCVDTLDRIRRDTLEDVASAIDEVIAELKLGEESK